MSAKRRRPAKSNQPSRVIVEYASEVPKDEAERLVHSAYDLLLRGAAAAERRKAQERDGDARL